MPKNSRAKLDANNRYVNKTYEIITARSRKSDRLNDLIDIAANNANTSKAAYILDSIRDHLNRDGITPDMLPPPDMTE